MLSSRCLPTLLELPLMFSLLAPNQSTQVLLPDYIRGNEEDCSDSLGLESGDIRDSQLSAFSSLSPNSSYSPQQARLHSTHAWCAAKDDMQDAMRPTYLGIDLGAVKMITAVAIQGNPRADQFVTSFNITFSVVPGVFRVFQLTGNSNRGEVTKHTFNAIAARFVKIQPLQWHGHVCLRLELKGCDADPFHGLGMVDSSVPDSYISASSSYNSELVARHGRLLWTIRQNSQIWVAGSRSTSTWLKIKFGEESQIVSAVATQGRPFFSPLTWTKTYVLSYSRRAGFWEYYTVNGVNKVFPANFDRETVIKHRLSPAIYANSIRFHPATYKQWPSLRVEVYTYGKSNPVDLGIANGEIPDSQITSSSALDPVRFQPHHGRLHNQHQSLSWCANGSDTNPYLQFDLVHVMPVTGVVLEPRGLATVSWVTAFQVSFSMDNKTWTAYRDTGSVANKTFTGNSNGYLTVTRNFDRVIATRHIRIHPKNSSSPDTCMRAGVVGYRKSAVCPEGWMSFRDNCYYFHAKNSAKVNTSQARASCKSKGGYLTDIRDLQESMFISRHIDNRILDGYSIGLNDIAQEGVYRWEDGSVATWIGWDEDHSGQNTSVEDCTKFIPGGLHPVSCSLVSGGYICKKKAAGGFFGSPIIYQSIPDVELYENEALTLQCQAIGDAAINIAWLHGGQVIQNRSSDTALALNKTPLNMSGSWKCVASNHLGTDTKNFYVHVKRPYDICVKHTTLKDNYRLTTYVTRTAQSDSSINRNDWYALSGYTGFYRLASTCVAMQRCNGAATGWLRSAHPTVDEGIVTRTVCLHSNGNCCYRNVQVQVRNCFTHFVHKLVPLDTSWKARYCAETYSHDEQTDRLFQPYPDPQQTLQGHVIDSVFGIADTWSCLTLCLVCSSCRSYNHNPTLGVCEINNASLVAHSLEYRSGYSYYHYVHTTSHFFTVP